jgi:translation initiation factor IF-3
MDYGKFKFDAAQRAKESRRKAVHVGIKEMKYRPKIGDGDFDTKTRQVAKFLEEGHKVKITIMFRGREVFHPELGKKILDRIADQMDGMGKSESVPRLDGRNMVMVLAPDKRAKQSAASRGPGHNGNGSAPRTGSPSSDGAAAAAGAPNGGGPVGSEPSAQTAAGSAPTTATESAESTEPAGATTPAETAGDGSPADESSEGEG